MDISGPTETVLGNNLGMRRELVVFKNKKYFLSLNDFFVNRSTSETWDSFPNTSPLWNKIVHFSSIKDKSKINSIENNVNFIVFIYVLMSIPSKHLSYLIISYILSA